MPEGHEGREIYGVIEDPTPDKGRALGRVAEKQGREIRKGGTDESARDAIEADETPGD